MVSSVPIVSAYAFLYVFAEPVEALAAAVNGQEAFVELV